MILAQGHDREAGQFALLFGGVQISEEVLIAGLMKDDGLAPNGIAVGVKFLNFHVGGIPISLGPPNRLAAIAGAGDFRIVMLGTIFGKLHAVGSPQGIAVWAHLGGRHLLILAFAGVEESKQRIAPVVDIKAVILSGTVAEIGDHDAVVRELFDAGRIQQLVIHVVADRRRTVWIRVKPAYVPLAVGQRLHFWLNLIVVRLIGQRQVHRRIGRPLSPSGLPNYNARYQHRDQNQAVPHTLLLIRLPPKRGKLVSGIVRAARLLVNWDT